MRTKKAFYNTTTGIIYQLCSIVCGFIIPRLILGYFGSEYNGMISSITQFLGWISILTAGVGGVTRAALYKPLNKNDNYKISGIINATDNFMKKIALIFLGGLIIFAIGYPFLLKNKFEWFFVFTMVLVLGINTFAQYFFGMTYQNLLEADQRQYIYSTVRIL
ncbi:TPA: sugar isomerase, partial [Enterococcus faecium]|nr:sugar isomerase [Enterococcus faecium]HCR5002154.1 sugar isomerase [Enterococcus faecium]